VLHQVGVGVLGPVFRTYDPVRDRLISVKAFQLDLLPEQGQELADRLARMVALDLTHPSLVRRVAAGVEGHTVYLAEDYIAAESLDIALRHYAPAPLETALPFIGQLAGAIDAARAAGVGHGALHPRDIFLTPEEARATGFGVSDALEAVGVAPPLRRPYSAPERMSGGRWGTPADVYALGAVAHELLTGRRPAGTGDVAPIAGRVAAAHPQLIRAVLALALAEDPADRYQTAAAFADALEAAARGERPPAPAAIEDIAGEATISVRVSADDAGGRPGDAWPDDAPAPAESSTFTEQEPEYPAEELDETTPSARGTARSVERAEEREPVFEFEDGQEPRDEVGLDDGPEPEEEDEPDLEPKPDMESELEVAPESRVDEPPREPEAARLSSGEAEETEEEEEVQEPAWRGDAAGRAPVAVDHGRGQILPLAGMLVIGLLVGFLAGYGLGSRERGPSPSAAGAETAAAPDDPAGRDAAQPFSEAAVEAPATPPAAGPPAGAPSPAPLPAPPPAGTPAPADLSGVRLVVRSTPAGARVRVNGADRGVTPLTLRGLAFGSYGIEVRREGYRNASRQVALTEQLPTRELTFQLERAETPRPPAAAPPSASAPASVGTLVADSRPRGARVFVDGRAVGTTPLRLATLAPGRHEIRFELAGFRPWRTQVTIVAGSETRVSGSLEREQE